MEGPSQGVEPETAPPVVSFKKRGARFKENIRKRPAPPGPTTSSRDDGSDHSSSDDDSRQGRAVKRRPQNTGVVTAASTSGSGGGSGGSKPSTGAEELFPTTSQNGNNAKAPLAGTAKDDATKTRNWFDEDTKAKVGPTRASASNVRMTTLTDFAPDVCKDYKKTGYCGFGDNCVFLHDRGDYKQGWELDREWENVSKGKNSLAGTVVASARRRDKTEGQRDGDDDDDEEAMLKNIPFACIICEQPYKSPIVTACGHYFCEGCALKRYRKDPSCAACGASTHGVFNSASRLKKLLQQKKERIEKKRRAAIEAGEQVSDEDADAEQNGGTAEV